MSLKNTWHCTNCGRYSSALELVIDPDKPRYAKKRDYIIGYLCELCDSSNNQVTGAEDRVQTR